MVQNGRIVARDPGQMIGAARQGIGAAIAGTDRHDRTARIAKPDQGQSPPVRAAHLGERPGLKIAKVLRKPLTLIGNESYIHQSRHHPDQLCLAVGLGLGKH